MNRRAFLGQASAIALSLPLPAIAGGKIDASSTARLPSSDRDEEITAVFAYTKRAVDLGGKAPDFSWLKTDEYFAFARAMYAEGTLKSISKVVSGNTTEFHMVFKNPECMLQYMSKTANLSSAKERTAAGFELKIQIS